MAPQKVFFRVKSEFLRDCQEWKAVKESRLSGFEVKMSEKEAKLYDLLDSHDPHVVLAEILHILSLLGADGHKDRFISVYDDILRLFQGDYPGYRASNTRYHNLEHTIMVTLGTVRLIHGCVEGGMRFAPDNILTGLLAALYHDAGLIQKSRDRKGTGAKYTIGHEMRSIAFMRHNMDGKDYPPEQMDDCEQLIKCTNIHIPVAEINFRSDEIKTLGRIVGSADLVSQIADRKYLEKLALLFKEFEEAGLPGFDSEEELIEKTEGFYKNVARKRLTRDMDNIASHMKHHFKARWNIDRDLYAEAIANNIGYLKSMVRGNGAGDKAFYRKNLKRSGIARPGSAGRKAGR